MIPAEVAITESTLVAKSFALVKSAERKEENKHMKLLPELLIMLEHLPKLVAIALGN